MKKIPTVFLRDPDSNYRTLTREWHPDCLWVRDGEGVATRKYDGSCCAMIDGVFHKRREVKKGKPFPPDFVLVETDPDTGKSVGWVPVNDNNPEDKWFVEAVGHAVQSYRLDDGTYEAVGPHFQGNPEKMYRDTLIPHSDAEQVDAPRTYDVLAEWLSLHPYEGIVWHHPDGRMAKVKRRDFPV